MPQFSGSQRCPWRYLFGYDQRAFTTFCSEVSLQADLKPEEVPGFRLRAHVVTVGGEQPDGRKFSFRFSAGGKQAAAEGKAWSDWLPFEREQIEATLKGYPAIYLKGWPVVVRLLVGGVVDPTVVEAELKFDGTSEPIKLAGELFGPRLGILLWRDEAGKPKAATMADYNQRYWTVLQKDRLQVERVTWIDNGPVQVSAQEFEGRRKEITVPEPAFFVPAVAQRPHRIVRFQTPSIFAADRLCVSFVFGYGWRVTGSCQAEATQERCPSTPQTIIGDWRPRISSRCV